MIRGWLGNPGITDMLTQMIAAIGNGDDVKAAALQAQIDAVRAQAEQAQATGQNARQMVLSRDVTLKTLQDVAAEFAALTAAADEEHKRLQDAVDHVALTPGPPGRDGKDGFPSTAAGPAGKDGRDGAPGADAYDIARAGGYGGTRTQWIASLAGAKGEKGDAAPSTVTDALDKRTAALEQQKLQIDYRDGISVPAVISLLGLSSQVDVPVPWTTPFPDAAITVLKPQTTAASASLLGKTDAIVKAGTITKTGCTVTVTTTALLAAGAVTVSVLAFRKG